MKKIKLLLPTLLIATYAPILSTSLISCNKFKAKENSVKVSKHLATFKVTGGDGCLYTIKDQDDSKIKFINKVDRVEESGKFYDVIYIAVIPQPDSKRYTFTLRQKIQVVKKLEQLMLKSLMNLMVNLKMIHELM